MVTINRQQILFWHGHRVGLGDAIKENENNEDSYNLLISS
jgi:hypothetical protein